MPDHLVRAVHTLRETALKRYLNEWLFLVLFWTGITLLYAITVQAYLELFIDLMNARSSVSNDPIVGYMLSDIQYLESGIFGLFFGSLFFGINRVIDRTGLYKMTFVRIILLKSVFYFLAIGLVFILMEISLTGLKIAPDAYRDVFFEGGVTNFFLLSVILFFSFGILLTNFVLQVTKNIGEKNLIPLFLGRYHKPEDEHRIFMFIDMRSSTTYAEKYGHSRFSSLIQDTVYDLNRLVYKYHAEIYQYVGDEIVLTWKVADGLHQAHCLKVFFAFKELLKKRKEYYIRKYNQEPTFKCAAHVGVVSVVEIGNIKREIAYHGDVLNTTARVQGLCNELARDVLITNELAKMLWESRDVNLTSMGKFELRGKDTAVEIYSAELS